ncbi:hypothetical protein HZF05_03720 [Sphingomonas sp. CGMCC 1.13654]|uniref:DUF4139 domain-containing protein n=1 Tax=Sphingomonas chungangi TaxID=2683589 RepID=A0A838L6J0_9SPHN|nr:hypothetical protein [Sphingomonas chungangi]MBA2933198.1 hypothetical protein [Sphingomonas chungangi]MVW57870.1 hypothetical protein [Sphingomonas chungangi]
MLALAVLLAAAMPAAATVESPAPDHVSLTVYRDPTRGRQQAMNLQWLGGFALITETRTIHLPAGDALLRFEGVSDGIIPASAIVTGLPGGTIEKNRDAKLLSPAALIDGTLGREVTIRRTNRKTGKVREEQATIVAGPANGVVLKTESGIETLGCAGLAERPRYDGVPAGLSAKPVLSVLTRSPHAADVTVSLSYLAGGFDWSASYVANLAPDGRSLDLFAWLTLADGNAQAYSSADLQAVAGRVSRRNIREIAGQAGRLQLRCYPLGTTTSDLPTIEPYHRDEEAADDIVVTGARRFAPMALMAPAPPPPPPPPPEDLGDLKLYRVPETVDVAPNGQRQVALLVQHRVAFEKLYRIRLFSWMAMQGVPATIVLRMRNEEKQGLGIPLPAGTTALYAPRQDARLLLGLGTIGDTAKGERTLLTAGVSRQILAEQSARGADRHITVTNASPFPVPVEVAIGIAQETNYGNASAPLERIDGLQTWRVTVPANGSAGLDYRIGD